MDYIIENRSMTCGSYEAERRRYRKIIGKYGKIWLYAIQENLADNIYVSGDKNSDGFGRRTLSFTLEDGTIEELKGPWSTNSDDLYNNTGIDLKSKHLTFVVISRGRKNIKTKLGYVTKMTDIVYMDIKPKIGKFERGEIIAKELANKFKQILYCYSQSQGGSSNSPINPEEDDKS